MSARALQRVCGFFQSGRLSLAYRCSSSSAGGEGKKSDIPKKPTGQPTSSGEAAESKPSPFTPPPPKVIFDISKYQAEELFQYNTMSFYDIECDMSSSRCPQPSAIKKGS